MQLSKKSVMSKIASATLSVLLMVSLMGGVFPQRAHAVLGIGDVVIDPTNLVQNVISAVNAASIHTKEYILDTLMWQVGNLAIQSMTKSLVNWINSGFKGSPAFVTDLNRNLRGVADKVASEFLEDLSRQDIATTPFQDKIIDAVRLGYYLHTSPESFYTKHPYTLNQVSPNDRAFLDGDFTQGGFNAWFETILVPANNPYTAKELAEKVLSDAVGNQVNIRTQEVEWGKGFLSWRGDCIATTRSVAAAADASNVTGNEEPVDLSGEDECLGYEVKSPGSVIVEQLNHQLGSGVDRLISADEVNEIVGALLNQLVSRVLGNDGLSGVSKPSAGGGASFIDQTATDSGGTGATSGTSLANNLAGIISKQRTELERYEGNWQRILSAAKAAKCSPNSGIDPAYYALQAEQQVQRTTYALTGIKNIQLELEATAGNKSTQVAQTYTISAQYNELIASSDFPTAEQIANSDAEANNPNSILVQLEKCGK